MYYIMGLPQTMGSTELQQKQQYMPNHDNNRRVHCNRTRSGGCQLAAKRRGIAATRGSDAIARTALRLMNRSTRQVGPPNPPICPLSEERASLPGRHAGEGERVRLTPSSPVRRALPLSRRRATQERRCKAGGGYQPFGPPLRLLAGD